MKNYTLKRQNIIDAYKLGHLSNKEYIEKLEELTNEVNSKIDEKFGLFSIYSFPGKLNNFVKIGTGEFGEKLQIENCPKNGTFYLVNQFEEKDWINNWFFSKPDPSKIKKEFTLWLGHATYYLTIDGKMVKVGSYYDSGD